MCRNAAGNENVWSLVSGLELGGRAVNVARVPGLLEPSFVWENILKYKARTGGERTLQYTVKVAFL